MQMQRWAYKEIEDLLEKVRPPRMALVEQRVSSAATLADVGEGVREALRTVDLPSGSVAIGMGSRGIGGIGPVVAAELNLCSTSAIRGGRTFSSRSSISL